MSGARTLASELEKIQALIRKARYQEALRGAQRLCRENPQELEAEYCFAVLLGDAQDGLAAAQIERNRVKSVRLLRPLLQRLKRSDETTRYRIRNEYYWFSRQPLKQYRAYVHLGLALGVLGRTEEMEAALRAGARIAGRPANYREFEEIRILIGSLRRS